MRIELANSLDEWPAVVRALEEFSVGEQLDMKTTQVAELVLDELLTNIISYGYPNSDPHRIQVEMNVERGGLKIDISDDGVAFNPFAQQAPRLDAPIEDREPGGFGIHLVMELMDEYSYQRLGDCNRVTLLKFLGRD